VNKQSKDAPKALSSIFSTNVFFCLILRVLFGFYVENVEVTVRFRSLICVIDDDGIIPDCPVLYVRVGENFERINSLKDALSRGQTRKKSPEILAYRVDFIAFRECTRVKIIYKINLRL